MAPNAKEFHQEIFSPKILTTTDIFIMDTVVFRDDGITNCVVIMEPARVVVEVEIDGSTINVTLASVLTAGDVTITRH